MISGNYRGFFGNHLFIYAVTRIAAIRNGYDFSTPEEFIPKHLMSMDLGKKDFNHVHTYNENPQQSFDPVVLGVADHTLLTGFFQTEKYFEGYEDQIQEWFHVDDVQIEDFDNTCYIHCRASDYKGSHILLPKDYFDKAKNRMLLENPNMKFKILTDDVEFAKGYFENDEILSDDKSNERGTVTGDFKILKSAKYLIISNSTFSWWAAWLNKNCQLVLAPEKWYNYNRKDISEWFPCDIKSKKFQYIQNS